MARRPGRPEGDPTCRYGSRQSTLIALLAQPRTIDELTALTGWPRDIVRFTAANLSKFKRARYAGGTWQRVEPV